MTTAFSKSKQIKWKKDKVINELQSIAQNLGHSPSVSEVPSQIYGATYSHFKGFNKAKIAAGLSINESKYNSLKKSALTPSREFAYCLGVIYGDGCWYSQRNDHGTFGCIALKVRDEDFALHFRKVLDQWSGLHSKYRVDKQMFHVVQLYSIDACRILDKFNLDDILKWKKEMQWEFLKGLFDSDGGVIGKNLTNRKKAKRWLHFSNNNLLLISLVRRLFKSMGIRHSIRGRVSSGFGSNKIQYQIQVYNSDGVYYYYQNIGFSIARKQKQLQEVISSYDFYSLETNNQTRELHENMEVGRTSSQINIHRDIVYSCAFDNTLHSTPGRIINGFC